MHEPVVSSLAASRPRPWNPPRAAVGRYAGVLVALIACCVYLSITQEVFLSWDNWMNIIKSNTVIMLLAVGSTFIVITAGIDLSIASLLAAVVVVLGVTFQAGWPALPALLVTLLAGLGFGLVNGLLIAKAKISFFVVTLGTLSIYQSFALLASGGDTISLYEQPAFSGIPDIVNGEIGPIPSLLLLWIVVGVVAAFVLRFTAYGRAVYAVGSNPEAARLAGIRVSLIIGSVYTIMGLAAVIAALVQAGRLTGAAPQADPTLLMTVIAAVLIGGTSYTGGEGGILGTIIGVLFLGVISNGLALSNVSTAWQGAVSGTILIVAVGIGALRDRGWRRRPPGGRSQLLIDDQKP
jgi:ribose transport system permease protein